MQKDEFVPSLRCGHGPLPRSATVSRPRSARNRDLPSNLYRRRDGRFYFRDPRTGRTFALGRDAASARMQALEVNVALAKHSGRERLLDRVHGCGSRTLRSWLVRYQELTAADPGLTPTTRVQYRSLSRQLGESLGDFTLSQLQPEHIAAALGAWKAAGRWSRAAWSLATLRGLISRRSAALPSSLQGIATISLETIHDTLTGVCITSEIAFRSNSTRWKRTLSAIYCWMSVPRCAMAKMLNRN